MDGTIVCGVDRSDAGRAAAQAADALARRLALRLVLAQAVDLPQRVFGRAHLRQLRAAAEHTLEQLAGDLGAERIESRVGFGDAAVLLARIAAEEDADLIVLGSRPRCLLRARIDCALASRLVRRTPVPILIAPPQTVPRSAVRLQQRELATSHARE